MAVGQFSPDEWKSLVNAPHWVFAALSAAERGTIFTRRNEAKALEEFLSGYKTQSPLVKEIIAGQKEADDKLEGTLEDAEKTLGQIGALLERKVGEDDGNAVRDFLMQAAEAVAKATKEALIGDAKSATETKTLARVETALKATEADKRRRHDAAVAAEAERRAEGAREAEARAAAARAEAQKKAKEAEAKRQAQEAEAKRAAEAEASRKAAEAEAKWKVQMAEAERRAAEAEAQKKAAAAEAERQAAAAEAQKQAAVAEVLKAADAAPPAAAATKIYVVKKGDTLSGIAQQMYGKAGRWREIFEANKDVIKNPNLIRPGWKLRIPD